MRGEGNAERGECGEGARADDLSTYNGYCRIDKDFWGSHVNLETKYILMEEAFEFLKFRRVAFAVDSLDTRSHHFLEGIGMFFLSLARFYIIGFQGERERRERI